MIPLVRITRRRGVRGLTSRAALALTLTLLGLGFRGEAPADVGQWTPLTPPGSALRAHRTRTILCMTAAEMPVRRAK